VPEVPQGDQAAIKGGKMKWTGLLLMLLLVPTMCWAQTQTKPPYFSQWAVYAPLQIEIKNDILYVNSGNQGVIKYSLNGTLLSQLTLDQTNGFAVDDSGNVYVSHQVFLEKYDPSWQRLSHVTYRTFRALSWISANDHLYGLVGDLGSIYKINADLATSEFWFAGNSGQSSQDLIPGVFSSASDITSDDFGRIFAVDSGTLQIFDSSGRYLTGWRLKDYNVGGGYVNPAVGMGVGLDRAGNIYVTHQFGHAVLVFSPQGYLLTEFGNYGTGDGLFDTPFDVAVADDGKIYVSDLFNNRIQVFGSTPLSVPVQPITWGKLKTKYQGE
jgi:hypothetical protein